MIRGFACVSTEVRDLSGQTAQLKAAGWATIFAEKMNGIHANRQIKTLMTKLTIGDAVIIPAAERISSGTNPA